MENKLCPHCNEVRDCHLIDDNSILNYKYRCTACEKVFERDTYLKSFGSIAVGVLSIGLAGFTAYKNQDKIKKLF